MHVYAPDRPNLYQQVGDEYVFAGDPTPFGYEGERHPFYGHHPVIVDGSAEPVYCLIDGPHFHSYAAPSTRRLSRQGRRRLLRGADPAGRT